MNRKTYFNTPAADAAATTTPSTLKTQPTRADTARSERDLILADRMLGKLRGRLTGPSRPGPSRRAVLYRHIDAAADATTRPADAAFERALDRLLDELEREADQPRPFDASADANERATRVAFDD